MDGTSVQRAARIAEHEQAAHDKRNWVRLTYRCNDGQTREAVLMNGDPILVGVHPIKWHRALNRWSESPENEPIIVSLQRGSA